MTNKVNLTLWYHRFLYDLFRNRCIFLDMSQTCVDEVQMFQELDYHHIEKVHLSEQVGERRDQACEEENVSQRKGDVHRV